MIRGGEICRISLLDSLSESSELSSVINDIGGISVGVGLLRLVNMISSSSEEISIISQSLGILVDLDLGRDLTIPSRFFDCAREVSLAVDFRGRLIEFGGVSSGIEGRFPALFDLGLSVDRFGALSIIR